jgi:uncharacterized protein YlxW (UPF0749 family)
MTTPHDSTPHGSGPDGSDAGPREAAGQDRGATRPRNVDLPADATAAPASPAEPTPAGDEVTDAAINDAEIADATGAGAGPGPAALDAAHPAAAHPETVHPGGDGGADDVPTERSVADGAAPVDAAPVDADAVDADVTADPAAGLVFDPVQHAGTGASNQPVDAPADQPALDADADATATATAAQAHAGPAPAVAGDEAARDGAAGDGAAGDGAAEKAGSGSPQERMAVFLSQAPWRRLSSAGALIWVLIALFGFTLVVQLRSNDTDQGLATARQEDLVRILSDLESREQRLTDEINTLEKSQRQLSSGVLGRQVALQEAEKRANELGLLAGTLPARGPGLLIAITPGPTPIKASAILNTVQELRGAGGEVMQLAGADGAPVRVVASTSFVDAGDAVLVDGVRLRGPYALTVIGDPQTMKTALNIPGGVVASVGNAGGTVIPQERTAVEVAAVRRADSLQYARPVS